MSKRVLELDEMKEDIRKVSEENNTTKSIKENGKTINDEIDKLLTLKYKAQPQDVLFFLFYL